VPLPHVHLITAGGTIAGRLDPSGTVTPGLAASDLLARIPDVASIAHVTAESFLEIPSSLMRFEDMLALAQRVKQALTDPGVAGVVITHGTGTLEQTAYFLDVVLAEGRPVVVTGAMRNPTLPSDDGPMNLLNSVQVAACPRSHDLGVLVVMNGAVHSARDVTKSHSASPAAFQSPEFGPLGSVDEDYVFYARRPYRRLPAVMPARISARAEHIPFVADSSDLFLQAALQAGVDGLVIESGRLTPRQVEVLRDALRRGTVVVIANPYYTGRLHRNTYRHEGAEAHLLGLGMIFSGTSGLKARVKLAILLSAGLDIVQIRDHFHAEWQ
jgi:L-asparaginase